MKILSQMLNLKKFSELETIEEKSFWMISFTVLTLGIISMFTASSYPSWLPTVSSALLCLFFPIVMMIVVSKKKNYHSAFPLLCITVGAVSIPFMFVFNGGFLSGMPLFCVITTAVTVLCYSPRWRFISLFACLVGNGLAFLYVYSFQTPFPLLGSEALYTHAEGVASVSGDVVFSYYAASIGMFASINFVINDIRKYKLTQDALQQFFDSEKRKEILKKALHNDLSRKSEHKKAVILFADISNFTPIAEKMPSDLISEYLNEFFSIAGKYIHSTGGIIDKYIGDCIMAYWLDQEEENCVLNAVSAMLNLKMEIYRKAEAIYNKYGTELNFSAGIAFGDVIFGDIGSDTMHDFTVIGDAVNTASRIQDFAVSGEMLISGGAAEKIKDTVVLDSVENDHFFKGKNNAIDVYRIVGLAGEKGERILHDKTPSCGFTLHICGCRGSFPVSGLRFSEYGGETSCYVLKKEDYALIVDCGTGLKNAMPILEGCRQIDILLTHVHYDHILGFLMSKFPENAKLRIYGRFDKWNAHLNTLEAFMEHPYWPVGMTGAEKINVTVGENICLTDDICAAFYPSDHPDDACVIKVMCRDKKIVFLADCENADILDPSISDGSELLFFDGMFDDGDSVNHKGWGHGTWQNGVRFLQKNNIKKMIITHHNPELGDHSLMTREERAREAAPNVSFAKSGDIIPL